MNWNNSKKNLVTVKQEYSSMLPLPDHLRQYDENWNYPKNFY